MFGSPLDVERPFGHTAGVSTRTRVRRRRLVALLVTAGVVATVFGQVANAVGIHRPEGTRPSRTYVIRPGDTVWSIATRLRPAVDPRIVVDEIVAANDLDPGALVPGRQISLPAVD